MSKSALTNFMQALAAVLLGNLAYFILVRYLPRPAHHVPFRLDLGTVVDFCFCLVAFGVIKAVDGRKHRESTLPKR